MHNAYMTPERTPRLHLNLQSAPDNLFLFSQSVYTCIYEYMYTKAFCSTIFLASRQKDNHFPCVQHGGTLVRHIGPCFSISANEHSATSNNGPAPSSPSYGDLKQRPTSDTYCQKRVSAATSLNAAPCSLVLTRSLFIRPTKSSS